MVYRTTNPTEFYQVDGIVISEETPPAAIQGVGTGTVLLIGKFERGPEGKIRSVSSTGELYEIFGTKDLGGIRQLYNKKFSRLKASRVVASDALKSSLTLDDGSETDIVTFTAKYKGAYGDNITVTVEAGEGSTSTYTIKDTNPGSVVSPEVYRNLAIASITAETFAQSKLVDVAVLSTSAEPAAVADAALTGGSDGEVADSDYETAISASEIDGIANVVILDEYTTARSAALKTHAANVPDRVVVVCGDENDDKAAAASDAASYRDADGRIIYAFPWVGTMIDGVETFVEPSSFVAAVLSQTGPHIDPADADNVRYLQGVTGLKYDLKRADYIALAEAGVMAFEVDPDLGVKIKSGINTHLVNADKSLVSRRRMTDFLTTSAGKFLKNYQNKINSSTNRTSVKAAFLAFIRSLETDGMLPKDSEIKEGFAKIVDVESQNSDASIAQGKFIIVWKQRLYSSMRFIVLKAEIGQSVVISEAA